METSWHRLACAFTDERFQFTHLTDGHRGSESLGGGGWQGQLLRKTGERR